MMKIIGPILLLYSTLVFAKGRDILILRGRVPASANVEFLEVSSSSNDSDKVKVKVNAPKGNFTVRETKDKTHHFIDVIYH